MKWIQGRCMTYVALATVLLSFAALLIVTVSYSALHPENNDNYVQPSAVSIDGQYSVDGGPWRDTIPGDILHESFRKATVRGTLNMADYSEGQLVIFADNIWFDLQTDSLRVANPTAVIGGGDARSTPGCSIVQVPSAQLVAHPDKLQVTLQLENPYGMFSNADLSDCFRMYSTGTSGVYQLMFSRVWVSVLLCILICFFGLFAFPIAGTVLGGIQVRYLAFSLLCFFTGIHLLTQVLYPYMPLWIDNPVLCMSIGESTTHLFGLSVLVFIKVILEKPVHRIIGNAVLLLFSGFVVTLFVLHLNGTCDLYASNPVAQTVFSVCAVLLMVCLIRELKTNHEAKLALFTLIPLVVTLLYDSVNMYFGISDFMLFEFGVAAALVYQIIMLVLDLRRQYKESIRYQQMQKELYESRVAIMVSQIQPHFLYNSLTSIAMMCSIDPGTAQEATITFADYLRGNMDSLKQKTPVPFSKELEHLKKYLYIEKLRFGDDLNIVYDIQTDAFVLPQLSIQPLVENAVKHGVGMKREGGTVTIATRETDAAFAVIVSDDGVGFDTEQVKDDGKSHIGMDNVRRRLREMCGGTVTIHSVVGEGTTATVTLPKEGQHNENSML